MQRHAGRAGSQARRLCTGRQRQELLERHTRVSQVAGLKLRLITENCELYHCSDESKLPFAEPWFAFCWPGGEALARFLLSEQGSRIVKNKSVLDVGSGCGIASLASLKSGAGSVLANDIDLFAQAALEANLALNFPPKERKTLDVAFSAQNHIFDDGTKDTGKTFFSKFDVVLVGDMLYDPEMSPPLLGALGSHPCVLFGDPGRAFCPQDLGPNQLLAEYAFEQDGFNSLKVFRLQ